MKVGTKSVLFGAHCWFIHPWFVAFAWWKLYGFPWDFRLWVAFFVHDLGYIGLPNMDGPEGEDHVWTGANIMRKWFDRPTWIGRLCNRIWGEDPEGWEWWHFCFYHSRFMAKKYEHHYSKLCVADKLAITFEPWWFYLPRVKWSGEIHEYIALALTKYEHMKIQGITEREWFEDVKTYIRRWVKEHKDLRPDTSTPERV
jgi:hypothetical protein